MFENNTNDRPSFAKSLVFDFFDVSRQKLAGCAGKPVHLQLNKKL